MAGRKKGGANFTEHKCPVCGKIYIPAAMHSWRIYKNNSYKLVCTYGCKRKFEKEQELLKAQKKRARK